MSETSFPGRLWNFSKDVIQEVEKLRDSGKFLKAKRLYWKANVTHFEYKEGNVGFQASKDLSEEEEWDWVSRYDFVEKTIKPLTVYSDLVLEISKRFGACEGQADQKFLVREVSGSDDYHLHLFHFFSMKTSPSCARFCPISDSITWWAQRNPS